MSSNTSIKRGEKGSKFWIQTLINLDNGQALTKQIQLQEKNIQSIQWKSPLRKDNYQELKTDKIRGIQKSQLSFWPDNGPWWDGVGIAKTDKEDIIILVEAKAHINETKSSCTAKDENSLKKIKKALKYTHSKLSSKPYKEEIWLKKYYQMANRLSFLIYLREQGVNVKLLLLNIVDDPTYISTSEEEWIKHYNEVFELMLGSGQLPSDVILLNMQV